MITKFCRKFFILIDKNIHKYAIEYCESICKKINNCVLIIYPDEFNESLHNNNDIYIFFGLHCTKYPIINKKNVYYVNLEQLTRKEMLKIVLNEKQLNLCDYSLGNISILQKHNINSIYLPYQVNYSEIFNYEKIYNFSVCCSWNPRINSVFDAISLKYKDCFSIGKPRLWGKERDNILFKTKVLANVHHREFHYNVLEEIRITRCILNKVIVVSEYSVEWEKYPLSKYVIFVDYKNMIEKIFEVLENYDDYYFKIYNDFDIKEIDLNLSNYINLFTTPKGIGLHGSTP